MVMFPLPLQKFCNKDYKDSTIFARNFMILWIYIKLQNNLLFSIRMHLEFIYYPIYNLSRQFYGLSEYAFSFYSVLFNMKKRFLNFTRTCNYTWSIQLFSPHYTEWTYHVVFMIFNLFKEPYGHIKIIFNKCQWM